MMADPDALDFAAWAAVLVTLCSIGAVMAGALAVHRFARQTHPAARNGPAVSVLKPLCGDEPMLDAALASICCQDYPNMQVVFGVQDPGDPALAVARRMQARFPERDIVVVVNGAMHGPNRKIGNLINMLPSVRHDILVFSDSDLHVPLDYVGRIVGALGAPGAGLVTTLCLGLPTTAGLAARLGASAISHSFVPGALMSRALGREDCLGTTMALRRDTLARVGGLGALVGHLADDNVLADRVHRLGLRVGLAGTVPMTAVPETSYRSLWQHELRWARTIRVLEPVLFATSTLQFPVFWAALAMALSGAAGWSVALFAAAWTVRAVAALWTDRALQQGALGAAPVWLLPLRDVLSVCQVAASYLGTRVVWRGHVMQADDGRAPALLK